MARLFVLITLFFAMPAHAEMGGEKAASWHEIVSPHFRIFHEANWTPAGIVLELEKIHGMLRLDMSIFSPWMATEKAKIYIYANQKSYVEGEFKPPQWSRGLAIYEKRCIVIYDDGNRESLRSVCSHELTHLFFESFFAETGRMPPLWLNEGLAVMMEDRSAGANGPWTGALKSIVPARLHPLKEHFAITNMTDNGNSQAVSDWYLESFGAVKFLFRSSRLPFKNFCTALRNGVTVDQALWNVYRYRGAADMDTAFHNWLFAKDSGKDTSVGGFNPTQSFSSRSFTPFTIDNSSISMPHAHH